MATRTLAAAAAVALSLAAPALADVNLGALPPPPTQVREWFRTDTTQVTESISNGHHQCVLHINNGATSFGVVTTGPVVQIWLHNRTTSSTFTKGYIRVQIDNYTPWRISGDADTATPNMFLSEKMSDASGKQFIPQLSYGQILRAETSDGVYPFSLVGSGAAIQATIACERSITGQPPTVRQAGPPTRDLML